MRFGISATSLMCPKNLRTRLRPVNVCCAIVASRYRRPSRGRVLRNAVPPRPGLNFSSVSRPEAQFQGYPSPEFVLQTFKTQNDARGAGPHPPVRSISSRTAKARNRQFSQRLTEAIPALAPFKPCFRAASPIWDGNRGDSRVKSPNPHKFSCSACHGASLLQAGGGRPETGQPPPFGDRSRGSRLLARDGFEVS